ncbi:MAG: hypothetical protein ABR991_11625 [Terracidiphilus sp.]|jgi:hypothetical protein
MKELEQDRMKELLQLALPPVKGDAEPDRDLWPAMLRRLDAEQGWAGFQLAWFDGALLAALVGLAAFFPSSIPLLLYYL